MEERAARVVGERSPLEGADPRLPRSRPARPSGETLPADRRRRARRRYLGKAPDDGGHRLQRHSRGRLHEVRHHPGHTRTGGPVRHRDRQRRPVGAHQAGTDLPGHTIATAGSGGRRGDRRPSAPSLSAPGHHPGDVRAGVRERRPRRCTHPRPAPVRHLAPHAKEPPPMTPQHLVLSADRLLPADPTTRGIARDLLAEVRTPRSSPPQARPAGAADRRRRLLRPDESPAAPDHCANRLLHSLAGAGLERLGAPVGTGRTADQSRAAFRLLRESRHLLASTPVQAWFAEELTGRFGEGNDAERRPGSCLTPARPGRALGAGAAPSSTPPG